MKLRTGRSIFRRLRRDERGTTIIEFAAVAAPFFALLVATAQTALAMFTQQVLDTAAEKAGRAIKTGDAQGKGLTAAQFKTKACSFLPPYMRCDNLFVDVQATTTFADIDTAKPVLTYDGSGNVNNAWQFKTGGPGDIVIMRLMYKYGVAGGPLGFDLSNMSGKARLMISTSVFKNEIY